MQDRPEDIANRDLYENHLPTRRVRLTIEADVQWDAEQPSYSLDVLTNALLIFPDGARIRNVSAVGDAEYVGDDILVNGQPAVYDAETDVWSVA